MLKNLQSCQSTCRGKFYWWMVSRSIYEEGIMASFLSPNSITLN